MPNKKKPKKCKQLITLTNNDLYNRLRDDAIMFINKHNQLKNIVNLDFKV